MSENEFFQLGGGFEHNKSFQNNPNQNSNLKRGKNISFQNSYKNI